MLSVYHRYHSWKNRKASYLIRRFNFSFCGICSGSGEDSLLERAFLAFLACGDTAFGCDRLELLTGLRSDESLQDG